MGKFFEVHKGTTRTVFLIGKYAFKIPVLNSWMGFLKGLLANSNERNIWHLCPNYFLPVIWSLPGGWLVCMPRAKTFQKDHPWYYCFMSDLFHRDNDDNTEALTARRYCEAFHKNVGWYKGKPICIDYGTYIDPDHTENYFNGEVLYMKIKTQRLSEELNDVPVAESTANPFTVRQGPKPTWMDLDELDIPCFTAKSEDILRFEDHGVLELEEANQGQVVWGAHHKGAACGPVDLLH